MQLIRTTLLSALAFLLLATPALALTGVHEDLLTIGDLGYVASGDTLEYEHFFSPAVYAGIDIQSIDSVVLEIGVADDSRCRRLTSCFRDWFHQGETASISVESIAWQSGQATANIFYGDVPAQVDLLSNGGWVDVAIEGAGDFVVLWSKLTTTYTYDRVGLGGSGSTPMPEPTAALVFALGALVMRRGVRRAGR